MADPADLAFLASAMLEMKTSCSIVQIPLDGLPLELGECGVARASIALPQGRRIGSTDPWAAANRIKLGNDNIFPTLYLQNHLSTFIKGVMSVYDMHYPPIR